MLPRVTAKNVGDVFLRHTVFPPRRLFLVGLSVTVGSLTKLQIKCHKISSLVDLVDCSDHLPVPVCQFSRIITRWRHSPLLHLRDSLLVTIYHVHCVVGMVSLGGGLHCLRAFLLKNIVYSWLTWQISALASGATVMFKIAVFVWNCVRGVAPVVLSFPSLSIANVEFKTRMSWTNCYLPRKASGLL